MSKRKYTHIKEVETRIIAMREAGMTRQEIADELGLEKVQIKAWITRYNRRKNGLQQEIPLKPKGRPRKKPLSNAEEYEREISRLQMENASTSNDLSCSYDTTRILNQQLK